MKCHINAAHLVSKCYSMNFSSIVVNTCRQQFIQINKTTKSKFVVIKIFFLYENNAQ